MLQVTAASVLRNTNQMMSWVFYLACESDYTTVAIM